MDQRKVEERKNIKGDEHNWFHLSDEIIIVCIEAVRDIIIHCIDSNASENP